MSAQAKISHMLSRTRAEEFFPVLSFDPDSHLFYLDGGFLGVVMVSPLIPGINESVAQRLRSALRVVHPPGTFIQFSQISTPDVEGAIAGYTARRAGISGNDHPYPGRAEQMETLQELVRRRARGIMAGVETELVPRTGVHTNVQFLVCSVKLPTKNPVPTEIEMADAIEQVTKIQESLNTAGLALERVDSAGYLRLMRRIFHYDRPLEGWVDDTRLIRDQILEPGDHIKIERGNVHLGERVVKVMSVKSFPVATSIARMLHLAGDPEGNDNQIPCPFMITTTLHYPKQQEKHSTVTSKSNALNFQAFGPLARFVPKIILKKQGMDVLVDALNDGDTIVELNLTVSLFAPSEHVGNRTVSQLMTYYSSLGFEMAEEKHISYPVFWNTLPLFPDAESIKQTYRYHTMASLHAAQFLPVMGEWSGTGANPAMTFVSRRGVPVGLDLYHSPTSYSAVVFAESGAGKSFFTNRMIVDYLSLGGKVWVFDVGRSYYKLAKLLKGEFMEFSEDSSVVLNPFTFVTDIDEDLDVLKSLIGKMTAPNSSLDAYQQAAVEEAIKQVWGRLGRHATVSDIAAYFAQQEDPRETDLAKQLFPFTRSGSYGRWFDGDNNLEFDNRFIVLELDHLKGKKTLQQVVLLQLLARIQAELFLKPDKTPRLIIVDEAWELLAERDQPGQETGMVAQFLEASYRKLRKSGAGAVIVTQSIRDLASSSAGRAIAENAPFRFILAQRPESVDAAAREGLMEMSEYQRHILKTVHTRPGFYSEIMLDTPVGWGVARLIEDRFTQVLFSTRGAEREEVMAEIAAGVSPIQAVENYLKRHDEEVQP
jgi:conjugal transfer ATP-binding protein TraC